MSKKTIKTPRTTARPATKAPASDSRPANPHPQQTNGTTTSTAPTTLLLGVARLSLPALVHITEGLITEAISSRVEFLVNGNVQIGEHADNTQVDAKKLLHAIHDRNPERAHALMYGLNRGIAAIPAFVAERRKHPSPAGDTTLPPVTSNETVPAGQRGPGEESDETEAKADGKPRTSPHIHVIESDNLDDALGQLADIIGGKGRTGSPAHGKN